MMRHERRAISGGPDLDGGIAPFNCEGWIWAAAPPRQASSGSTCPRRTTFPKPEPGRGSRPRRIAAGSSPIARERQVPLAARSVSPCCGFLEMVRNSKVNRRAFSSRWCWLRPQEEQRGQRHEAERGGDDQDAAE